MGFTEILTIVFIVLKLLGVISWSWWLVCLPEIIAVAVYLIIIIGQIVAINKTRKEILKMNKDLW